MCDYKQIGDNKYNINEYILQDKKIVIKQSDRAYLIKNLHCCKIMMIRITT